MLLPPALAPGATIRVVAPSGPFEEELLRQGTRRLAVFDVQVPPDLWGRRAGFFAGSDEVRLVELQSALDSDAAAILVARGGYGIARLLPRLTWTEFAKRPKWLIGFSDATCLHAELSQRGFASIHGPNGTTLAQATDAEVEALVRILTGGAPAPLAGLDVWSPGSASGPLFGGNLTVLFAEAAAGRLRVPRGALLFLEDVTETSYRVDRMLTALVAGGHFDQVGATLLGDFVDCSPGKFDVPTPSVLRDRLGALGVPVGAGLPIGHGSRNTPLVCGAPATWDGAAGRLTFA